MPKEKLLHKQLVKAIAKRTSYYEYQVEDILHSLALVIQDKLNEDLTVCLKGLGAFNLRISKPRTFVGTFGGKVHTVQTKRGVSLKPDLYLRNAVNPEIEPEVK